MIPSEMVGGERPSYRPRGAVPRLEKGLVRARAYVADERVIAAVASMGRTHLLTPKQMELLAVSTLVDERDSVVEKLGVSRNTFKTRVRYLLRALDFRSLDALGKAVLLHALELARPPENPEP